ncbi:hypothetical protein TCDM_09393 [Trypanosoma cruzi Dm28c]|uniref:Uncharacterized protein n=1 Tax=Trypanosoma cruzi Dm28c TaxID=1416333 RepID=V5B5J3_TRYCR|nr:hypothetical protein TCDM_09393 [Trypanosoma cruzi Dm28c]
MTPRTGNTCSHGGHRAAASAGLQHNAKGVPHTSIQWHRDSHRRHTRSVLAISARDASQRPAVAKSIPAEHRANAFVCVSEEHKRRGAQGGTSAQQEAQLDGSDTCGTAPTSTITHGGSTHPSNKKENKKKKTRRQGVAVCVALRVSASPGRKENKTRGNKCVRRPTGPRRTPTRHGSLSAPFVAAPPHACSRRGAQGRRHERVGGCASGAVGRETHGTPRRKSAAETIKEGRVEKQKNVHRDCPKSKRKRDEG